MTHPGYFTDSLSNQPWYRCLQCPYDVFSQDSIIGHVRHSHGLITLPENETPLTDWYQAHKLPRPGPKIGLGFLTWNTAQASIPAAKALVKELCSLELLGLDSVILWADNGSTDGTVEALAGIFAGYEKVLLLNPTNVGQCPARNQILRAAVTSGCDYLLMVDGDIEPIHLSSFALYRYLAAKESEKVGSAGFYSRNCTHEPDSEVARECRGIEPWMMDRVPQIAWTNYGMFRREVFETCKFEENGPFSGPGWGFEDDDYQMQMTVMGYESVNTKYFRHLHRRRHSSVKLLGQDLATKVHAERKVYLLSKWSGVEAVSQHLARIQNQIMPVLEY